MTQNEIVQRGITWSSVQWAFTDTSSGMWHPLTWLAHTLDCQFFGLNSGAHHLVNLLVHSVNAMLVFFLLRRVTGSLVRSAFVACLFAWHPLRIESQHR